MQRPSSSTTGMRRTWYVCMAEMQVSRLSSLWQVTGFDVTNLLIGVAFGSRPDATTVTQRSRSVMIPINWRDFWSSTTGTDPTLWSRRILATFSAVSLGVQQIGSGVITSLTFIGRSPRYQLRVARTALVRGSYREELAALTL